MIALAFVQMVSAAKARVENMLSIVGITNAIYLSLIHIYNYYSYKVSGFFFFPLPVGRLLLKTARKEVGIVFSELDLSLIHIFIWKDDQIL